MVNESSNLIAASPGYTELDVVERPECKFTRRCVSSLNARKRATPEELANIQDGYNEVYEKRHQRIEEKKAALQEQATQEAEQPDEPQPEAEAQTEPQAEEIAA